MPPLEPLVITIFLVSVGLVLHSYIFYPMLLALIPLNKQIERSEEQDGELPFVSIVIAAHNEESVIQARVENALASDYPNHLLEVLIASDGSSDGTEAIVSAVRDSRVRLMTHQPNQGKAWTLNRAIPDARGSAVVLSDANTEFDSGAVRQLVLRLMDSDRPLAVCGKLQIVSPKNGNNEDGLYWRYESWIKSREGAMGAALGANGGIYAIWRDRYCPIPGNTILDDMSIPLLMKLKHGGQIVFDATATAVEEAPSQIADEFERRVRISAGAFQSLGFLWPLLHPRHGLTAFGFFSHKVLRWITPQLLIVALASAAVDLDHPFYRGVWVITGVIMLAAWFGRGMKGHSVFARLVRLTSLFVGMNAALLVGFFRWLRSPQNGTWKRTSR